MRIKVILSVIILVIPMHTSCREQGQEVARHQRNKQQNQTVLSKQQINMPKDQHANPKNVILYHGGPEGLGKGLYQVVYHSESCLVSRDLLKAFYEVAAKYDKLKFAIVDSEQVSGSGSSYWPVGGQTPWILLIRDGEVIDKQFGGYLQVNDNGHAYNLKILQNMLARNELIEQTASEFLIQGYPVDLGSHPGASCNACDLVEADYENANLRRVSLAGTYLRGANLNNASMDGALLSYTDLYGANLTGASLENVYWNHTICPDGTRSDQIGGTCFGHLSISR